MGKVDDIMRRRKVDDLMRRRARANRSFLGWTPGRGEEGSKTTDRTRRIVVWGILVAAGIAMAGVIAWVWGVQQLTASRVPADAAAVLKLINPPPDGKWVPEPARKGWKNVDATQGGGVPQFEVSRVDRYPYDVKEKAKTYYVHWYVTGHMMLMGYVEVQATEGWERRATELIRQDIAKELTRRAEEAKAKAAVEKTSKQP